MREALFRSVTSVVALYFFLGLVGFTDAAGKGKPPPPPPPPLVLTNSAIVYVDGESIKVADADGGNQGTLLTSSGTQFSNPSWSPDGNTIIFGSDLNGEWGIYRMKLHRNSGVVDPPIKITAIYAPSVPLPQWSPRPTLDGNYKIVYADWDGSKNRYFIKLIDVSLNGEIFGEPFTLATDPLPGREEFKEMYPTWSPDAFKVAIITRGSPETLDSRTGGVEIITLGTACGNSDPVCEVEGSRRNLVDELLQYPFGSYSPYGLSWANKVEIDGTHKIAVGGIPQSSGNSDVWVITFNETNTTNTTIENLTNTNNSDPPDRQESTPVWSPDDSQIMYAARDYLCEQPKNKKPQTTPDLLIRNVNGDLINGCEEKRIVISGSRASWWRGP